MLEDNFSPLLSGMGKIFDPYQSEGENKLYLFIC